MALAMVVPITPWLLSMPPSAQPASPSRRYEERVPVTLAIAEPLDGRCVTLMPPCTHPTPPHPIDYETPTFNYSWLTVLVKTFKAVGLCLRGMLLDSPSWLPTLHPTALLALLFVAVTCSIIIWKKSHAVAVQCFVPADLSKMFVGTRYPWAPWLAVMSSRLSTSPQRPRQTPTP